MRKKNTVASFELELYLKNDNYKIFSNPPLQDCLDWTFMVQKELLIFENYKDCSMMEEYFFPSDFRFSFWPLCPFGP